MTETLVDSSVMLDMFADDPAWGEWSAEQLARASEGGAVVINTIVYAEISAAFATIEALDGALIALGADVLDLPRPALFLAARAFLAYRRAGGPRTSLLPDFFIGAHASVADYTLLTRDLRRTSYFPRLRLVSPSVAQD